ncbi:hypothetical protein [Niveibacterium sp.]|uniref:hypothetical protein n=1 Tax=Niveibacterium sp. TaxID=2017444 RepID=UPI0035B0D339
MAYPPESDALYEQQACQCRKSGDRRKYKNVFGNFVDRNEFTPQPGYREICHVKTVAKLRRPLVGLIGGSF